MATTTQTQTDALALEEQIAGARRALDVRRFRGLCERAERFPTIWEIEYLETRTFARAEWTGAPAEEGRYLAACALHTEHTLRIVSPAARDAVEVES